jgi:release factor glutamine methyltransferase
MNFNDWLFLACEQLKAQRIESFYLDCIILAEYITGKPREYLLAHPEMLLTDKQTKKLGGLVSRRQKNEPISYIINKCYFYNREYYINNSVLIPKPESEDFINLLKKFKKNTHKTLLDIGTGSGCLAITAKLELPKLSVYGSDNDIKALEVARRNALLLNTDIKFVHYDYIPKNIDNLNIIFANLPYVPIDYSVSAETRFEPKQAIFSGADGLEQINMLMPSAHANLKPGGLMFIESLIGQQPRINALAKNFGFIFQDKSNLVSVYMKY